MATWQVQQAKAHLSELLDDADNKGAQTITKHGVECAVVLSTSEYRRLVSPRHDAHDLLLNGPGIFDDEDEFLFERDPDCGRAVHL
jgi:antitoxin Phd